MTPLETVERIRDAHLKDYYRTLRKHRWLVCGLFLATVLTVGIYSFVQTPIYQATATVLIEPEPPKVLNIQEVSPIGSPTQDYYRTQYEIMTSRPIVEKVIESLNLKKRMPGLDRSADPVRTFLGRGHHRAQAQHAARARALRQPRSRALRRGSPTRWPASTPSTTSTSS
jgi:uncharacterized protein involved in exopolysaccharide biosynthesis